MIKQQSVRAGKEMEVIQFNPESSVTSFKFQRVEAFKYSLKVSNTPLSLESQNKIQFINYTEKFY